MANAKELKAENEKLKRALKRARANARKRRKEETQRALAPIIEHYTDEWGNKSEINHEMGG